MAVTSGEERELVVQALTWEAEGVVGITLTDPAGADLPAWEPGAHLDVQLPVGSTGQVDAGSGGVLSRQYSLCGDPTERGCYRLGVLREVAGRGGSAYVHGALRPGQRVRIRGPRNHFRLEPSPSYVFIAGGIGITPILAMIDAAQAAGARWTLLYGGRTAESMAYTGRLAGYPDQVSLRPQDAYGLLDLESLLGVPQPDTLVYCCGPEPLISAVERHCQAWPDGALHVERFAAPATPVRDPADEHSVEVELSLSGRSIFVHPLESVLEALTGAGVDVLSDCREGICGTCETRVLAGEVDHRDFVLTDAEKAANQYMMVCVSRGRSAKLVLEL